MNIIKELDYKIKDSGHTPTDIKWLTLSYGDWSEQKVIVPPTEGIKGYSKAKELYKNTNYNNGYGSQELDGIVVFNDNSWLERWEYDGSEGWDFKQIPQIENYLRN